ncbi:MAG: sulfotransferase [Anaerolineae bacterium]|nr:sulfotransferase [Anaerolineae bacterium]
MTNETYLGDNLIFLISQPRAGSTLLQHILAGSPRVQSAAEPWIMLHPIHALRDDRSLTAVYDAHWAYLATQNFLAEAVPDGEAAYLDAIRAFAQVLYGRALAGTDAAYFLDKTPRYYRIIPELYQLLPRAKFVFLWRNPLAVLQSILSTWISENYWPRLAHNADDLRLAPGLMQTGIAQLGDAALVVRYEDLVTAPEATITTLCEKLDLPFAPDMLTYGERPALTGIVGDPAGIHQHSAPSAASLDKWRTLGDSRQTRHFGIAYLDDLGADTVHAMGYDYADLRATLAQMQPDAPAALVQWRTVTKPAAQWRFRERLAVERGLAVQQAGSLKGNALFVAQQAGRVIRKVVRR